MKKGIDAVNFALNFSGNKYVLGAIVPKDDPNYNSAFDCAELVAYTNYQTFGILYGTDTRNPAKANIADAYTGYFKKDAKSFGKIIPVDTAIKIAGAMILRYPAPGAVGHIIFSQGNGMSIEANSTKLGCGEFKISGRHFDIGILLPGVDYTSADLEVKYKAPKVVYMLKFPFMADAYVKKIQSALGFKGKDVDGVFGMATSNAVVQFQQKHGLVIDGQILPEGETAVALKL